MAPPTNLKKTSGSVLSNPAKKKSRKAISFGEDFKTCNNLVVVFIAYFFRHLELHRYCVFCSKQCETDVYHMIKQVTDECPFYRMLLDTFYPKFGDE